MYGLVNRAAFSGPRDGISGQKLVQIYPISMRIEAPPLLSMAVHNSDCGRS